MKNAIVKISKLKNLFFRKRVGSVHLIDSIGRQMNFIGRTQNVIYLKPIRIIPATRKTNAARPRHRIFIMYPGSSKIHSKI